MRKMKILNEAVVLLIVIAMIFSSLAMAANTREASNQTNEVTRITSTLDETIIEKPTNIGRTIVFEDSFETYDDWLIDFPPWTCIDVDGNPTFTHSAFTFPHATEPYAWLIFNPQTCVPPQTEPALQPHTGEKMVVCWAADGTWQNDDWLITPELGPANFDEVSFWAHSYSDVYQLERFEVGVSTTDTNPSSFTIISPSPYVEPPLEWTLYTYDISNYAGQSIYIGIHGVSYDSWILMVDDFTVTGEEEPTTPLICCDPMEMDWDLVKPGTNVDGSFHVWNCGDAGSTLNWEVDSWPDWMENGSVVFTPSSGSEVHGGPGTQVNFTFVAPSDINSNFAGTITVVNTDDPSDYCEMDTTLVTPRAKGIFFNFLEQLANRFPILQNLFGF